MWFDKQELYGQIKKPQQFFELFQAAYSGVTKTDLACPRDGNLMIQATIKEANLPFEACEQCGGMWFDKGEVEDLNKFLKSWETPS